MDLLKEKIGRLYWKFLLPSLFSALVTTVYSFVDAIAIGQGVGADGAAASAIIYPIFGVANFLGFLCGIGGSVRLGNARGSGKYEKANAYYSASLLLAILLTIVVCPLMFLCRRGIFTLFGANEALMPLVLEYGDWIIFAFPAFILSAYLTCMVRSDGSPGVAMGAVIAGGIFNIFGDWFLVFPMGMGMAGAAIATAGGTVIQLVILTAYLFTPKCQLKIVKPQKLSKAVLNIVTVGFSASVLELSYIVQTCLLNNQIMRYGGETAMSVFSVVLNCSSMFQHIFTGVGQAIQPIAANNYGAGKIERIFKLKRISIWTVLFMGICFALIGILFPVQITSFFIKATPEILKAAPAIIRTYFLSFLFMGINIWATFYLQSLMETRLSAVLTLSRGLIISSVLLILLPIWFGINGVWWAMVLTEGIVALITFACVYSVNRKLQQFESKELNLQSKTSITRTSHKTAIL